MDREPIAEDGFPRNRRSRSPLRSYEDEKHNLSQGRSRSRSRSPDFPLQQSELFRRSQKERAASRRERVSSRSNRRHHRRNVPSDVLMIEGWQGTADMKDVAQKFEAALSVFSAPREVRLHSKRCAVAKFSTVEVRI